ncbi:Uncharacterised protein [Zhongshania aliphaticivorans]|uniref:Uncharacterized protein n=1 Tax=Zhongshania aliphaticivorans TaxID=1470434 RepID=A0A5S9N3V9_9GAMM|nr:hypothetical protein [Zhongshania aliphaticivorans]CAA0082614.1 Uncharacterised protein [Zhongshania aliphaticivorans]CAA0084093.1 Uncharacterised protein [Zhongshania aliphaticivorans]
MALTALQAYDIEKALTKGQKIEAIKLYREATSCDLSHAKAEVEKILVTLKKQKPWYFNDDLPQDTGVLPNSKPKTFGFNKSFLAMFFLVDTLIFAGIIYYFVLRDSPASSPRQKVQTTQVAQPTQNTASTQGRPKSISLPRDIKPSINTDILAAGDSFDSLYQTKLSKTSYIRRKSSSKSSSYDSSGIERKIKTARSNLAQSRIADAGITPNRIQFSEHQANLDGVIDKGEWDDATALVVDEASQTVLYFKTDGQWLFIACDAPQEKSAKGYDQLRVYFHAGLTPNLVNERIHIGRSSGVTSIRQTTFRWQGKPPQNNEERWKKYAINDWGLYRHAYGTSSMRSGHRQYEAAILLAEAGLHRDAPFTLYAEIETDPLKNAEGKFVERQYLGALGDENNPLWMVF